MTRPPTAKRGGTYQVLLYYLYTPIDAPALWEAHQSFCRAYDLRGRIWVAPEGINGTISGPLPDTEAYEAFLRQQPGFADIWFKKADCTEHVFAKLKIRLKQELVTWRLAEPCNLSRNTGTYLSPQEFQKAMADENVLILDSRNDYEYELGHFRNAMQIKARTTRDFTAWLAANFHAPKDQHILTYCTGGVRCEKLTAFLKEAGYINVSQLHGGIIAYAQDPVTQGSGFLGLCYVFDERKAIVVNQHETHTIVGKCWHCQAQAEQHINCTYDPCHYQHLVCPACLTKKQGYCSRACAQQGGIAYAT